MKNLSAVDLNLLVAFDALLSERNVTRAARRIGLSQPALSKALHRLREIFDDPLFERRGGVMQPTEIALKLGRPVRRALNEIQSALAPRDFDPGKVRGIITIGSLDFYDLALMPAVLARITREAPGLELVVLRSDRLLVHKQFANNEIEFSLMPISDGVTELHSEPLFTEKPVTLMREDHPLANNLTIEAFAGAGHVSVAVEGQGASWIDVALAARGLQRRIILTLPNFASAPFIIGATDLISTLPERLIVRLGEPAGVIAVPPPLPARALTIHLGWHPRSSASPLHIWLRGVFKSVAATI
jgi:LysR family transcriptional regulator, transcriptional activator of nodD3 and syrA